MGVYGGGEEGGFLTLIYDQLRAVRFCHTQLIRYAGYPPRAATTPLAVSIQQVPGPCFANMARKDAPVWIAGRVLRSSSRPPW